MAREALKQKELHRKKLASKFQTKRAELKKIAKDQSLSPSERMKARFELDKLPKNSCPNRQRNRCALTGRPRAYYRFFGLSRIEIRRLASHGELPGVVKSSW